MERDFLGLSSKEPVVVVKEEVNNDGFKEIGFAKGSGIQWPFSNKVTAVPHFMSFKVQDDKPKKILSDPLAHPGFMTISAADAYDRSQKRSTAEIQTFPVSNQAIPVSVSNPFYKNHFSTDGQNLVGAGIKQQFLGGIPVTTTHSILPTVGSVGGINEPRSGVKTNGSPQLTIFYAGTVNVYDDISPEKAQAIMLLAGNGSSMAPTAAQPKVQAQGPSSKPAAVDGITVNQHTNTPPGSGLPSPLSVSSHTGAQSGSGSNNTEEQMATKTTGAATTSICKLELPNMMNPIGSVATTTTVMPSGNSNFYAAIPQARKASLALFLEKRKQRAMNAAPYSISKKFPEGSNLESSSMNVSAATSLSLQGE